MTNVSEKPVYDVNVDFRAYSQFDDIDISDMVIKYPSGLTKYLPWEGSVPVYEEEEEYLPVLWIDTEDSEKYKRTLNPGESLIGYYSIRGIKNHIN